MKNRGSIRKKAPCPFRLNWQVVLEPTSPSLPSPSLLNGFFNVNITSENDYTYRFTWLNDVYKSDEPPYYDTNLMIMSAFFDNTATAPIPEPATMLLLGSGLLGLGVLRKKFKK